jgi:hypothetical protein
VYTSITRLPLATAAITEVPAFAVSLVVAEVFYKFRSFSLELVAFLITWFVLGWIAHQLMTLFSGRGSA